VRKAGDGASGYLPVTLARLEHAGGVGQSNRTTRWADDSLPPFARLGLDELVVLERIKLLAATAGDHAPCSR
jgi:hypothetical protein